MKVGNWNDWPAELHEGPEQRKRQASAVDYKMTPLSLDRDSQTCQIQGSGKVPYNVSLAECTCSDFTRRKKPCKHMYRLAMELGIFPAEYYSYSDGGYSWIDSIDRIEKYPESVQEEFCYIFSETKRRMEDFQRKKTAELDTLIADGYVLETGKDTPKYRRVRLIFDFFKDYKKVNSYFKRKLSGGNSYWDPDTGDYIYTYPDDEVSALLAERGFIDPSSIHSSEYIATVSLSGISLK